MALSKSVNTYLFFGGRCQEALAFYTSALGAKVEFTMLFSESPEPVPADMLAPEWGGKIMHSSFRLGDTELFASDGMGPQPPMEGFMLTYPVGSEEEGNTVYAALSEGGSPSMPMSKTFFSPYAGMVKDKFGVDWMVMIP